MEHITHEIILNLNSEYTDSHITVRCGDGCTTKIVATLYSDGQKYDVREVDTVLFKALRPDGTHIIDEYVDISGRSEIVYILPTRLANETGDILCYFQMAFDDQVLATSKFTLTCTNPGFSDEELNHINEYNALISCMRMAKKYADIAKAEYDKVAIALAAFEETPQEAIEVIEAYAAAQGAKAGALAVTYNPNNTPGDPVSGDTLKTIAERVAQLYYLRDTYFDNFTAQMCRIIYKSRTHGEYSGLTESAMLVNKDAISSQELTFDITLAGIYGLSNISAWKLKTVVVSAYNSEGKQGIAWSHVTDENSYKAKVYVKNASDRQTYYKISYTAVFEKEVDD